jgi:hypothetical protein
VYHFHRTTKYATKTAYSGLDPFFLKLERDQASGEYFGQLQESAEILKRMWFFRANFGWFFSELVKSMVVFEHFLANLIEHFYEEGQDG